MRKLLSLLYIIIAYTNAFAQPNVKFDKQKYDLGTIVWNQIKTAEFTISNTGNQPLKINNVEVSCGCTVVNWDKKPIEAGKSSIITVSYNAEMLGHFTKHAAIYTNASERPVYISLYGNVVAQAPDYSGDYTCKIGDIKLSSDELEFDDINRGDIKKQTIDLFNEGTTIYKPELMHLPKYLTVEAIPQKILPNHGGKIIVTLNSNMLRDMGLTQTSVYLSRYPGDKVDDENEISVSAVMLPASRELSKAELAVAPHIALSQDTIELDGTTGKDQLKGVVTITNTGKSPLLINSLQVFNTALNVGVSRKIAAGKQTKMKITVLNKYLKQHSRNRLKVLMITNDPQNPKITVYVKIKR